MHVKYSLIVTFFSILFGLEVLPAYAVGPTNLGPTIAARAQAKLDTTSTSLKNRAQTEISRRVTSLTEINTRINALKRVSSSQKATISAGIQTEIANLNALNTKIAADTDIETLRTDVKSIVADYRVYLLYIPQVRIMATADALRETEVQMTNLANKISTRLTEAQENGKNVESLEATLSDMQEKLSDAQSQTEHAVTVVQGLLPKDYPGNKTSLTTGRTDLQTARADLSVARNDAQTIIKQLKAFENIPHTPDSAFTPMPTATPVVTP